MRCLLAASLLLVASATAFATQTEIVGGDWLVVDAVDARGRAPWNPDALLTRYLLERAAPPPAAEDAVQGTKGGTQRWRVIHADDAGGVAGGDDVALAYRRYASPRRRVVLATLDGASALVVNGTPYVGDVYGSQLGPFPVALAEGENHVYVRGVRGSFRLLLEEPRDEVAVPLADTTLPDAVAGEPLHGLGAVLVVNASERFVRVAATGGAVTGGRPLTLPPLGVAKLPFEFTLDAAPEAGTSTLPLDFGVSVDGGEPLRVHRDVAVRGPHEARRVTFRSAVDGAVQRYAVLPPSDAPRDGAGLVLSLHGAGVDSLSQARAYSARPGVWIVAPTNCRPFGFDWQDWGRTDAYEALQHALAWTHADPARVCLTGHSMGGHGTWHLAANDPDRFAAIAPSAGWVQFDVYGGRPALAMQEPWRGADRASETFALVENLAPLPTYVLHGVDDDNVPLEQAQRMLEALRATGASPLAHFQEGAGHWWDGDVAAGADCVDWPPIFDLFATSRAPRDADELRFLTVDPAVDADHLWFHVEQPWEYGRMVRVHARRDASDVVTFDTENARLVRIGADPATARWKARRPDGAWIDVPGPVADEKSPELSGPFKRAFGRRFVLVVGTAGSARESRELLERARSDAATWRYRANGRAEVLTDTAWLRSADARDPSRNVILYGNADTNAAWDEVFEEECPVRAVRGGLVVGDQTWERDDLAAVFVQRRRGGQALAAAFADTGPQGTRLQMALLVFVSGVGYPDYAVFAPSVLAGDDSGVLAAGWFDHRWRLPHGE